jgi:hypothetical protein
MIPRLWGVERRPIASVARLRKSPLAQACARSYSKIATPQPVSHAAIGS